MVKERVEMNQYNIEVGEYFRKLRVMQRPKLTQEGIAKIVGEKSVTYAQWERGLYPMPLSVAKHLCEYYKVDFVQFFIEMERYIK